MYSTENIPNACVKGRWSGEPYCYDKQKRKVGSRAANEKG